METPIKSKIAKTYENLNLLELSCIAKSLDPTFENKNYRTKQLVIDKIKEAKPDFNSRENKTIYYFSTELDGTCKLMKPDETSKNDYKMTANTFKNEFSPDNDQSNLNLSSIQHQYNQIHSLLTNDNTRTSSNRRFGNLKWKIAFDESKGIHHFFGAVERYAQANNITSDQDLIIIAINGLSESDYSDMVTENLSELEKTCWSLFKEKVTKYLGKTASYYKSAFLSFKRNPSESLGLMFSRLTFTYRKAYKNNLELNITDKTLLISAFISKLNPRLSQLLRAEESTLDFNSVACRAEELENIYCLNTETSNILAVIDQKFEKTEKKSEVSELIKELRAQADRHERAINKLVESFTKSLGTNHSRGDGRAYKSASSQNKPRSFHGVNQHELKGFCQYKVLLGTCNNSKCRYKHDNIPKAILDLKKN